MENFLVIVDSASNLRNADGMLGISDPYARLTLGLPAGQTMMAAGQQELAFRTKTIQNNLSPRWNECVLVASPPATTTLKIAIYDSDGKPGPGGAPNSKDDLLGVAILDLADAVAGMAVGWNEMTLPLQQSFTDANRAKGTVTVSVRPYVNPTVTVVSASKLRNADGMFNKSDPFARVTGLLSRERNWGETDTVRDSLDPVFPSSPNSFEVDARQQSTAAIYKLEHLVIELWDEDGKRRGKSDDPLGTAALGWRTVWPETDHPSPTGEKATVLLSGRGAKKGSTVTIACKAPPARGVSRGVSGGGGGAAEVEELGSAGKSLLQQALMPPTPPASAQASVVVKKVPRHNLEVKLAKGMGFKIADCCDDVPDHFTLGLAWDVTNGKNIDLDASCVWLDGNANELEVINFAHLTSSNRSMVHMGDEQEGDEAGDDESIRFDLSRIPGNVTYLCFCINSFTGEELNDVKDARCRLYNTVTLDVACEFDLSRDKRLDCTALLMCIIFRNGTDWHMQAIGEAAMGQTAKDNVDEFQNYLLRHPLVAMLQQKPPVAPKVAKMKVPAAAANSAGRTIGFKTPSGGKEEVRLPDNVNAGDTIEVPIIDIYVA